MKRTIRPAPGTGTGYKGFWENSSLPPVAV